MQYSIEIRPKALKDLSNIDRATASRILSRIEALAMDLSGDVRRLVNMSPEYRLRVGDYRVLFDVDRLHVVVQRVLPRDKAYQ